VLLPRLAPSIQRLIGSAVISARYRTETRTPLPASPAVPGGARVHVADLLLPASLVLWALGVRRTNATALGPYGLVTVLPIVFYAGLALLVVSAGIELARRAPSPWRMAMHAVALVVMLYGTAPLVYSEGRYSWLYKTIGVVQYINAHGQLDRHIDIYQNWPGFFALAAWFGKVAGVGSPLAYAKWAQLVFELAALPLLYLIYDALSLTVRQRWLALLVYSASNWVGQDYFSPQALGTLLSLGIMAIAMRWLYVGSSSRSHRRGRESVPDNRAGRGWRAMPPPRAAVLCATLLLVYFVLTFTHELSPYMLAVQLGALGVARLLRPWWLGIALAAIAVGYLLPRLGYVNSTYGLLNSFGNFFGNVAPPKFPLAVAASQKLLGRCGEALSVGLWGLAMAGAWLRRRSGRSVLALVLLTLSPIVLLAAVAYGHEGILRVFLFTLPWTAALAASALVSEPRGNHRADPKVGIAALRAPVALGLILTLFFPIFFGSDRFEVMPKSEVAAVTSFLQNARGGPVFCANITAPLADTARYNLFPLKQIFGAYSIMGEAPVGTDIASVIAANAQTYTNGTEPAYVMVTSSMIAYNQAYGATPSSSFPILLSALAHSRVWKLVVNRAGTVIYELPPPQVHLYSGPWKIPELRMPAPLPPLLTGTSSLTRKARPAHHHRRRERRTTASPTPSPQP
jgi:hypothetical protein